MGRETKLLLGLLATLLGVFVGVLSMKLLVPRPPAGAGPDIQADTAATEPQDLVEPPPFSAAPLTPPATPPHAESPPVRSRFAAATPSGNDTPPPRDPFVSRASFEEPAPPPPARLPATTLPPLRPTDMVPPTGVEPPAAFAAPAPAAGSTYVARPGDSWWSLAESVYGDGRLYRAVFAWNRAIDPRVSLVPGTALELPPRDRLEAAWPALMPNP